MKIAIGILSTIIVITGAVLTFLALWDIYQISLLLIAKAAITVALVFSTILLLWLIKTLFFKTNTFAKTQKKQ